MIPKIFHLIWHEGPISYLRYLTFLTLRKCHPHWIIKLHINKQYDIKESWGYEQQDFQSACAKDYMPSVKSLVDQVVEHDKYSEFTPIVQSDFLRLDLLLTEGGFYLDTDQIIIKPFDDFIAYDYVYAYYVHNNFPYAPNGVLGAAPNLQFLDLVASRIRRHVNQNDYNSTGPNLFKSVYDEMEKTNNPIFKNINKLNTHDLFYSLPLSFEVGTIYDGTHVIRPQCYALHWFGGHPLSQNFNRRYSESIMSMGVDTISKFMNNLINGLY